jgi:hypothetical protein
MKTLEEKKAFYERCSEMLGIAHVYNTPVPRRNRWNARRLGNGRYPGFGLIQCYGNGARVVSRHGTRWFDSYETVYEYLQIVLDTTAKA